MPGASIGYVVRYASGTSIARFKSEFMAAKLPTFLHVDDNPSVLSFVGPELQDAGFSYVTASTGLEALHRLETEHPDVVVLDVMLGDSALSGLDVCKKIREDGHRMPAILDEEAVALWLDPATNDPKQVVPLLKPYPAEEMEAYRIADTVNNWRNEGPKLIEPVGSAAQ